MTLSPNGEASSHLDSTVLDNLARLTSALQ